MTDPSVPADAANEWDELAESWDSDEAARAYSAAAFASLVARVERSGRSIDGANVIDFGCGTGLLTERLVSAGAERVWAVDTSPAMLAALDHKVAASGWTHVATAPSLPEAHGSIDLVVCSSVCGFLDNYPATVQALAAQLGPGGLFVQWDWERVDGEAHGLTRQQIVDALEGAGLEQVEVAVGFEVAAMGHVMAPLMGSGSRSQ